MKKLMKITAIIFIVVCASYHNLSAQIIFEAEDAFISAGNMDTEHAGYTGDGFVDTENAFDVYVEWSFNALQDYTDTLGFRYALGKDEHRTMQVIVNDELIDTIDFDNTFAFTTYLYKYTIATLTEGANKVKLVSINAEGAPNLDHLMVKLDTNKYFRVNTSIEGAGAVTKIPDADSLLYGTRIKLTPVADEGYAFSHWSGDINSPANPLTFTIDQDYTLQAVFRNTQLAFPGAEGFAQNVTGGRGGIVIEVTNLNNSGPGSLRAAIESSEVRTIVFRVSGTIDLQSNLSLSNGNVTIAGQTAPGGGITLSGYPLKIAADNVIIRFIRSRLGDIKLIEDDAMNGRHNQGVILDHCTMSWSVDETASFYDNTNFTMQYCLISESLWESVHDKGRHGYGGIWGGKGATFHHNLLAHHTSRNPRFCGSRYSNLPDQEKVDFRNNVIFNWGSNSVYGAEGGSYNLVNNYYKYGPATGSSVRTRIIAPNADDGSNNQPAGIWGEFYVDGNYVEGYPTVTEDNWIGVHANVSDMNDIRSDIEFEFDTVTTHEAVTAFEHVVAQAGVILPKRDIVDERIINETLTGIPTYGASYGEGRGIIDTQDDVGGWPVLEQGVAPDDTDHDGMPDYWEIQMGLDINDPEDRNGDLNNNGYTNLEDYLNEKVASYTYIIRPFNFEITDYDLTEITLEWENNLVDETGYLLERKLRDDDEFIQIAEIPADETSYIDPVGGTGEHNYRLRAMNASDTSYYTNIVSVDIPLSIEPFNAHDIQISLAPNPFSEQLNFEFELQKAQEISIALVDITGQIRDNLLLGQMEAGNHNINWQLSDLQAGFYLVIIHVDSGQFIEKLMKQ